MKKLLYFSLFLTLISCSVSNTREVLVSNKEELTKGIKEALPGDVIVMSNGIWKDVEIKFKADGLAENPIILKAETPGKVFIEGQSFLKIGGHFLEVHDLFFRNGFTPINSVIQFKTDNKNFAYDCKVVNCVIEDYTQLDRMKKDHWVEFWGQRNELKSCYIAGKSNNGPTVRVMLKGNQNANCYHVISNNYFGPRPRRGGPHGETMQIGDSYTSMVPGFVQVENNYFDSCNGEVEVISNKSNYNTFSHNVFNKCEGSLVLRHGNYATVDSNWFLGDDNSDNIGGIRVVNTGHWITNNYFYKIKGNEFRSAIAVMNGIPKSPLNRYNQVTDVVIAHNSWVDCITPLQFSVGSNVKKKDVLPKSEIRSALPIRTTVANNLIYNSNVESTEIVRYYDTPGDIDFENNFVYGNEEVKIDGFENAEMEIVNDKLQVPLVGLVKRNTALFDGFNFSIINQDIFSNPRNPNQAGAICSSGGEKPSIFDISKYGAFWYSSTKNNTKSKSIKVKSKNEFLSSLNEINAGDTLIIESDLLKLDQTVKVDKSVVIMSLNADKKAIIQFVSGDYSAAFILGPDVDIIMNNIVLNGDKSLNCIMPDKQDMSIASNVFIDNCELNGFKSIYQSIKGSFADTIQVTNSLIGDLVNGFILNSEIEAIGDYNAEFLILKNNQVANVEKGFVDFYRGGYDESTIGGNFVFENNNLEYAGITGSKEVLLETVGIVNVHITDNTFSSIKSGLIAKLWGEKNNVQSGNIIKGKAKIITEEFLTQKLMY